MSSSKQRTKDYIIKAFFSLLEQKSYAEIKIEEVILKSEISKSTFYKYFAGKESLLDGAILYFCIRYRNVMSNLSNKKEKNLQSVANFINNNRDDYLSLSKINSATFDVSLSICSCWKKHYPEDYKYNIYYFCYIMNEFFLDLNRYDAETISNKIDALFPSVKKTFALFTIK